MCHVNRKWSAVMASLLLSASCHGCTQDMADQPRYEPLEASAFFANGMASRPLVEGTVPRGHLRTDQAYYQGIAGNQPTPIFPIKLVAEQLHFSGDPTAVARQILSRGQQRFTIFCAPCHGRVGDGDGMVVKRGFPRPPSLQIERLREAPVGHIYDVATRGFGRMPSYASQVPPADRWAIVAYLRALQLSQRAPAEVLSPADRARMPRDPQENPP